MRDLEQELVDTLARGCDSNGQPREGFLNLTQRMENETEDQLDVDITVLDFLLHKAISAAFEWQARPDKYDSDLPNALITMTAVCLREEWQPTSEWYDLAGQFMLQAVIDQYVITGCCHDETRTAIFAFGSPGAVSNDEKPDIAAIRTLFCKDESPSEEHASWAAIRRRYVKESNELCDFEGIVRKHPYVTFEKNLLSFLQHLHDSVDKPDLMQVEEGRLNIDGNELSRAESREIIDRMRV
ncbi:hypothetical protein E8E13_007446 [Curvularia kusanoi]|uniref:Uncharacterized protein n=1 Tax=Curvularia kusanoi TaxID=90978 RepID=A0A9P4TI26_CURKU|nr:hypothetical protein E8E13_007446 [Curvularia kusanoi]